MPAQERMSAKDYLKEVKGGDSIAETPLSKQIRELLDLLHLEHDRIQSGRIFLKTSYTSKKTGQAKEHGRWIYLSKSGTPDRWCLIHKRLVFIEVKVKGKLPSKDQVTRQAELAAAGAIILNVDSFEDARAKITGLQKDLDPKELEKRIKAALAGIHKVMHMDDMDEITFANLIMRIIKKEEFDEQ